MADPIDIAVGERIRGRRKALRISQAMLAEAIGVRIDNPMPSTEAARRLRVLVRDLVTADVGIFIGLLTVPRLSQARQVLSNK